MSKKTQSPSNKAYFIKYKADNVKAKNAAKRLASHAKRHPNDEQSVEKPVVSYNKGGRHENTK
jgi:hypothetical protein